MLGREPSPLSLAECPSYELSRSTALGGGFECFGLPAALASQHPMPLGQLAQPLPGRTAGKANGWARLRQGRLREGFCLTRIRASVEPLGMGS